MSATPVGEFSFLAEEAAELGVSAVLPSVGRVDSFSDGIDGCSALRWGVSPAQVVWLHGAGLNAHTWDGTIMATGFPSLAIDLPGHGDSAWRPDGDYSPQTNAGPVVRTIESMAPAASVVVGQSLGGLTALAVAATRPDLVRSLVLIDISPGVVIGAEDQARDFVAGPESYASRAEIIDRATQFGLGGSPQNLRRGVFLNTRVRDDGRVVFKHHLANMASPADAFSMDFRYLWPAVEALRVPVLLIGATNGLINAELEAEFVARVPDSTAISIEAGHNVQEDAPLVLAAAVSDFTAANRPTRT